MNVECGIQSCRFNDKKDNRYGQCQYPTGITLKWRLAADLGKAGSIVYVECLQMEIPEPKENDDGNKSS